MNALFISTDRKIFDENSDVRRRMVEYGNLFDELHIIVFNLRDTKQELRVTKISENVFVYPTNSRNKLFYIWDAFRIGKALSSKLKALSFVISTQDPFETGLVGLLLKWRYGVALQVQLHTDFTNKYFITHSILNFIRFPLGLFVLSFADSVRVVSEKIAKSIHSLSNNIYVLPVYTPKILYMSPREYSDSGEISILTASRLEKEKDLPTLLKAFKQVINSGIHAHLVIAGSGSEMDKLKSLTKELGLIEPHDVLFLGWQQEDLKGYYRAAHVYVSTSLYEGYGMSVVQAAQEGTPLILSNTGVANEIFFDGESAFIVKQRDAKGFAEAIIKLAKDPELRKKMGEAAEMAVKESFVSNDDYLKKYKYALEQAVEAHNLGNGIFKKNILLRYLVAGVFAASTNIGLLYIFTDILKIWYLYSSILSFIIAIIISFTLQKFWTFNDKETSKLHHQFTRYFGVAILGIIINISSMYVLVDLFNIWYILAQIITGVFIAVFNFLMYKFFIFNREQR